MDIAQLQARVDRVPWYHEFDFGNGVRATVKADDPDGHRRITTFIDAELAAIDFRGKTVLDIGCWDGYWSFYAERRGARHVVAADDYSQNWSSADGINLAKELLGSRVEIVPDQSIYELTRLGRTFDIVLCLGVFYHLWDPFHSFAQLRHCCHAGSVLALEGNVSYGMPPSSVYYTATYPHSRFTPTGEALDELLRAAYLTPNRTVLLDPLRPPVPAPAPPVVEPNDRVGWRWRMRMAAAAVRGSRSGVRSAAEVLFPPPPPPVAPPPPPAPKPDSRVFVRCDPLEAVNPIHGYRPPFGLHQYDPRFRDAVRRAA